MTRGYDVYCEMTADSAWLVGQISLATSTTINYLYRSPKLSWLCLHSLVYKHCKQNYLKRLSLQL